MSEFDPFGMSLVSLRYAISTPTEPIEGESAEAIEDHSTFQAITFSHFPSIGELIGYFRSKKEVPSDSKLFYLWRQKWSELPSNEGLVMKNSLVMKVVPNIHVTHQADYGRIMQYENEARDRLHVQVKLVNIGAKVACEAGLVFDTGFSGDLLLSQYKAEQLKLEPVKIVGKLTAIKNAMYVAISYGYLQCGLMVEKDNNADLQCQRQASLEVLAMSGTSFDHLLSGSPPEKIGNEDWLADLEELGEEPLSPTASTGPPPILQVSPIKQGRDKHGFDALLGYMGMKRLGLGIDPKTHRLVTDLIQYSCVSCFRSP